uniref:Ribosomal protein L34 n=1 Tax=Phaeophyceae sp. TaxID=2249243 RepID=A0A8E5BHK6_9PHAE|nr:ribosomal protein L34 [Phaeophyceae sp.]
MTKRTLGGTNKKAIAVSGFRSRMKTNSGCTIINNRRRKKRKQLSISYYKIKK